VIDEIQRLMVHDTAGDPMTDLKWTRKTTEKISCQLKKIGIQVSPPTVGRLLKGMDYSLRVNRKSISKAKSPDRNRQFEKIKRKHAAFAHAGCPIISVDSKKKELVGQFKNPGAVWAKAATPVNDHDFRSDASGIAVPYGLYEPTANRGHVFIGISHDTAGFATDAIAHWWGSEGKGNYPSARRLLILADNGGGNGSRNRQWKVQLQEKLANAFGLSVTVCHYPPGASKWNPIEHRLFSAISKNWAGQPLNSYETVLKYIQTTTTKTGLTVKATLMRGEYPTGIKTADNELAKVKLRSDPVLPVWNYTINPSRKM
jgi:hypothetical protein